VAVPDCDGQLAPGAVLRADEEDTRRALMRQRHHHFQRFGIEAQVGASAITFRARPSHDICAFQNFDVVRDEI